MRCGRATSRRSSSVALIKMSQLASLTAARARAQVELDAVRPGGGAAGEELRLGAALLPLRLRLDQAVVDFLQARQTSGGKFAQSHGLALGCRCTAPNQAHMDSVQEM